MQISRLTAYQVPIVLRNPVRHASHTRTSNDTLLIRCELSDGSIGWGEGLPREYVTGESVHSVWRHLEETDLGVTLSREFRDAEQLFGMLEDPMLRRIEPDPGLDVREGFGNSVRCAIEISVLDAAGKSLQQSVGDLLHCHPAIRSIGQQREEVFYSGAVTSMSPRKQWLSSWKMRLFGFRMVKVKVGTTGIDDLDCLRRVRAIVGPRVDLRLDANEAWSCHDLVKHLEPLLPFAPTCLEQPVPHSQVCGLREVRQKINVPVMLDESLCCLEDARRAVDGQYCDMFNIRLSKCGGLIRSLKLAAFAHENGLGYQLGCQVGETGILSAAGRHFACNISGIRYLEGSFDRFLVRDRLTREDLTFGYRGRGLRLSGPGLGVTIDENHVNELAIRKQVVFE
ncbi:MAG: hypothetical protein KDA91_11410 [Planctomycetaceae bacterium]|nr:hypothetical protein [Planctomycetaceae bacterium]